MKGDESMCVWAHLRGLDIQQLIYNLGVTPIELLGFDHGQALGLGSNPWGWGSIGAS